MLESLKLDPRWIECNAFAKQGKTHQRIVIIAPVKITEVGREMRISWSCSIGDFCEDKDCVYAHGSNEANRKKKRNTKLGQ